MLKDNIVLTGRLLIKKLNENCDHAKIVLENFQKLKGHGVKQIRIDLLITLMNLKM